MEPNTDNPETARPLSRWWYAFLLIPFIVYLKGLAPSVVLGDTGDYLAAGWIWGVSHPSGYPLYTILVGIFQRLPIPPIFIQAEEFSELAWRANFLSMIFALWAIAAMFALVNRLTHKPIAALIAAGALAFGRAFWWHAEIAENDALSSLFIILVLLLAVRWVQEKKLRDIYLLALTYGLAFSHHQSILLYLPAVLIYLGLNHALKFRLAQWIAIALLFILGLTPFIYLPIVKYRTPDGPLNFISESEYQSLARTDPAEFYKNRYTTTSPAEYFFRYIGRSIYGEERKYTRAEMAQRDDITTPRDVLHFSSSQTWSDYGYLIVFIIVLGFLPAAKPKSEKRPKTAKAEAEAFSRHGWTLILTAWLIYFLVIHLYPSGDILNAPQYKLDTAGYGLLLPLEILWAAIIGLGLGNALGLFRNSRLFGRKPDIPIMIIGLGLVAIAAVGNFRYGDKSHNTLAHEYVLNALNSCPQNATLVVAGDELYAFWFMHAAYPDSSGVNGYRPDINLTTWSGELEDLSELSDTSQAMANALVRLSIDNPEGEINTTFFNSKFLEQPQLQRYQIGRRGLLFAFIPQGGERGFDSVSYELMEQSGVDYIKPDVPMGYKWDFWGGRAIDHELPELHTGRWLWAPEKDIQWRYGEMLLFYGSDALLKNNRPRAMEYFEQLVIVEPDNPNAREYLNMTMPQANVNHPSQLGASGN